ncbi:MAG: 4Fe-4S dicluster domain-containing protein, partial [Deltaproteobacteria bacterium]|nr:4Fe-4S dicluster domain-containing protein [Deltaproteobacteria bacterium]
RDNCILCGLCARVCAEIVEVNALTFKGRGDSRGMGAPFQEGSADCIGCASCASVCPTSCISVEDVNGTRTIWDRKFKMVCCDDCGAPLMTEEYRDYAVANRELSEDYYTTCVACKKTKLAARFAKVGS